MAHIKFIQNEEHYREVLCKATGVKESLWIGTADIKDLYMEDVPFLSAIAGLIKKGVDVRLIHAKEPGPLFREEFDRHPVLFKGLQRVLCPRTHFKIMVFDYREVYVGSANLTGAGIGAKGASRRNFEAGILTDEFDIVDAACNQFDDVFTGKMCRNCSRKDFCGSPVIQSE